MKKFLTLGGLLSLLFLPTVIFAADSLVPCNGPNCNFCHLIELGNNLLDWLIKFSVVLSAIAFAWAGIMMVTAAGNMTQVQKAKSIFSNVFVGLIILLASWLIVDTVMASMVGTSFFQTGSWNKVECT